MLWVRAFLMFVKGLPAHNPLAYWTFNLSKEISCAHNPKIVSYPFVALLVVSQLRFARENLVAIPACKYAIITVSIIS